MNMTDLKETREEKRRIERAVLKMLIEFEHKTGLCVDSIELEHQGMMKAVIGASPPLSDVKLDIKIV